MSQQLGGCVVLAGLEHQGHGTCVQDLAPCSGTAQPGTGTGLGVSHSTAELMLDANCLFPDFTVLFPWAKQILIFCCMSSSGEMLWAGSCSQWEFHVDIHQGGIQPWTHVLPWDR